MNIPKGKHLPSEFKTDEWWKKRGLWILLEKKDILKEIYENLNYVRFNDEIKFILGKLCLWVSI